MATPPDPKENWENEVLKQGELPGQNVRLKKAGNLEDRRQDFDYEKASRTFISGQSSKIRELKELWKNITEI